jgi:hypothetical protein
VSFRRIRTPSFAVRWAAVSEGPIWAGCDRVAVADPVGHVFACLLWIVVIHFLWAWGMPFSAPSCLPQGQPSGAYEEGIACSPSSKPRSWDRR